MHKEDYEMLADEISRSLLEGIPRDLFIDSICHRMKVQNSRFDADKFKDACKPKNFGQFEPILLVPDDGPNGTIFCGAEDTEEVPRVYAEDKHSLG